MFNGKKRKQRLQEQIAMIRPTSKAALKQQCLFLSNLDVEKAQKMYDFLVKDLDGIPSVEAASKPFIRNLGEQASGVFSWIRENEDMISQGVSLIRGILGKRVPAEPIPPINP
jgi:hypothetical protein